MISEENKEKVRKAFEICSPLFIALGDPQRQKLILDISENTEEGLNVSALTEKSHLSRPAISHHLKVLKDCGLVESVKKGTQIFYRLKLVESFNNLQKLVDETKAAISQFYEN